MSQESHIPLKHRSQSLFDDPFFSDALTSIKKRREEFQESCRMARENFFKNTEISSSSSPLNYLKHLKNEVMVTDDSYKVIVDVHHFNPENLCVKVSDHKVTVEGKENQEEVPFTLASRQFLRTYTLPNDVNEELVHCSLTSDGILQITAPRDKRKAKGQENYESKTVKEQEIVTFSSGKPHQSSSSRKVETRAGSTFPISIEEKSEAKEIAISQGSQDKDKDKLQVFIDVQHFTPEEITVTCDNNVITVQGKHDEKKDEFGTISRQFTRKYELPKGLRPEDVMCNLSSSGILQVSASPIPAAQATATSPANETSRVKIHTIEMP